MNKKQCICFSLITLSSIAIFSSAVLISNADNVTQGVVSHSESCNWHHYQEVAPTYDNYGAKEYWICCDHNSEGPVFNKPSVGNITESTHSASFLSEINDSDSRYLAPYKNTIDFENGYIPAFIKGNTKIASLAIVDNVGAESSKALKVTVTGSDYRLDFAKTFLDAAFANSKVCAILFDAKADVVTSNFRHGSPSSHPTYEVNADGYGLETGYKTFSYSRDYYNAYTTQDSFIYGGGLTSGQAFYIDNIRLVTNPLTSYGFEGGRLVDKSISGYENKASLRFIDANKEYFVAGASTAITNYCFDYINKTEGNRSLKITKGNGYVAFFMPNLYSSLSENSVIYIDIYSTVGANGTLSAQNFLDGFNYATYGNIGKNKWTTIAITKTQIESGGRFLIIQGSTAGDWYFDNIRIEQYSSTASESHNLGDIYVDGDANATTTLNTNKDIEAIKAFKINDVTQIYTTAKIGHINKKSINFNNTVFAMSGSYKIVLDYVNNKTLYSATYYAEVVICNLSKNAIALSATYGTNDYYTLSGYPADIYRMMCGDQEVPFEASGSDYLIPIASLIQLLPENSGSKVSGEVKLLISNLSTTYLQKFNITLSGTSKNIPSFNGAGISTHAYSSTASQVNTTNYTSYFNSEKVAEYQNSNLTFMYEQAMHVSTSDSSLKTGLNYLINNAMEMGMKVMLSDDAFNSLSRTTESIIGKSYTFSGKNYTFNSSNDIKNFCKDRLAIYINNPGVQGVNVVDEPYWNMLNGGIKDLAIPLKEACAELGNPNFYLNYNLHPMSARGTDIAGPDATGDPIVDYKTFIDKYFEVTQNKYVQFDIYPLADNTKGSVFLGSDGSTPTGISMFGLANVIHAAELAKEHDAELYVVTQSFAYSGVGYRYLTASDIAFLNNALLGVGVKHISYFVYRCRQNTGSESWYENGSFLDTNGNKTNVYHYYKGMLNQIKNFGNIVSAFDYDSWAKFFSKQDTSISRYFTYANKVMTNWSYSSSYGDIRSISVTSGSDYALITALKNKDDNNLKMYMLQNSYNHFGTDEMLQSIELVFKEKYTYAIVYECGLPRVVNLRNDDSLITKRTLAIKLSAGHAVFAIPYI